MKPLQEASSGVSAAQSVPENRRRVAIVKGTCIARRNRGWRTSFTIRNHIGNAGGIERTFPLCVSPELGTMINSSKPIIPSSELWRMSIVTGFVCVVPLCQLFQ